MEAVFIPARTHNTPTFFINTQTFLSSHFKCMKGAMEPECVFDVLISSGFRIIWGVNNLHLSDWMVGFRIYIFKRIPSEKVTLNWSYICLSMYSKVKLWCSPALFNEINTVHFTSFCNRLLAKDNQEILFLSFTWVQSSPDFSGDLSCRNSTHQIHAEVKIRAEHSTSAIHSLSQLQSTSTATMTGFITMQIFLCIQAFLRSKHNKPEPISLTTDSEKHSPGFPFGILAKIQFPLAT